MVLSPRGLQRAAPISEQTFAFIGKNHHLKCPLFQAVFIAPRVHWLLQQDATLDSFVIEWKSQDKNESRVFEFLEQLMNGKPIDPLDSEVDCLCEVATVLGNTEFLNSLIRNEDPINRSTVCGRLRRNWLEGRSVEAEIAFAASHFYEIESDELKGIDGSLLELIVGSERLVLASEDSLLNFIMSLGSEDYIVALLRYLWSECLSCEGTTLLMERRIDSGVDRLLWDSLCRRLLLPSPIAKSQSKVKIPMKAPKSLDGIISYLTKKHGGNVQEKGIVTITSKSVCDPEYAVNNVADLTSDSAFTSENTSDQWICWDFGEMRVRPTNYTMNSMRSKSWVVEVSVDGHAWTEIDRQVGIQVFRDDWVTDSFAVSSPEVGRYIRLTQTEKNHFGAHFLSLKAVEFFGTLYE
jgi:hypothetical protein